MRFRGLSERVAQLFSETALLTPALTAPDLPAFFMAANQIWANVKASDFPARAERIARVVDSKKPDILALQEVSDWQVTNLSANEPSFDFLAILHAVVVIFTLLQASTLPSAARWLGDDRWEVVPNGVLLPSAPDPEPRPAQLATRAFTRVCDAPPTRSRASSAFALWIGRSLRHFAADRIAVRSSLSRWISLRTAAAARSRVSGVIRRSSVGRTPPPGCAPPRRGWPASRRGRDRPRAASRSGCREESPCPSWPSRCPPSCSRLKHAGRR